MKDSLSNEVSYYDILDIAVDADSNEIKRAFEKALGLSKYAPQQIANARKQLLDTESRLREDFFLYTNESEKEISFDLLTKGCSDSVDNFTFKILSQFDKLDLEFLEDDYGR